MAFHSFLFILSVLLLSGCTQPLNDRPTLGGIYRSPTFITQPQSHTALENPSQHLLASTPKPRIDWSPTQYIAPMDSAAHSPTLALFGMVKKTDPPRIYGRYPTTNDALYMQQSASIAWINDALFTIYDLGRSFIGSPYAFGYRTATGKIAEPMISPSQPYKRTQTADTWSSGFPTPQPMPQIDTEETADND